MDSDSEWNSAAQPKVWPAFRLACTLLADFVFHSHCNCMIKQRQRYKRLNTGTLVWVRMSMRTHKPFPPVLSCQASSTVQCAQHRNPWRVTQLLRDMLHGFCVICPGDKLRHLWIPDLYAVPNCELGNSCSWLFRLKILWSFESVTQWWLYQQRTSSILLCKCCAFTWCISPSKFKYKRIKKSQ
jgi:hypothetical protein